MSTMMKHGGRQRRPFSILRDYGGAGVAWVLSVSVPALAVVGHFLPVVENLVHLSIGDSLVRSFSCSVPSFFKDGSLSTRSAS